jgi:transposase-like protein
MTERERDRNAARRLAILRHAREVTGNVSRTCRYYGITRQAYYTWLRGAETASRCGSMPNNTYGVRSQAVSTVKKSSARSPWAWALRNSLHEGPLRRGAGPRPSRRRIVRIVVADTRMPSFNSSPRILR